ncbi:MAG: HlyD family secretion protein [Rhizobiales bacterium]|nr:HlyD family secretion protein [Hyphomicrobiales bacterium]
MQQASSWIRVLVTVVVVAAAGVAGWYLWRTYEESPWTRDGRVRVNIVMVAPDVAGAVTDLRVKDNQSVRIGDTLFTVDPARYRLALAQAEAVLAGAKSVLEQRQEEQLRRERLSSASISEEALNQARTATLSAQASYDQAEAALGVAKLNLARTDVRSPVNGHVTNLLVHRGDYATAGRPMVALVDGDSFYVAGYFEETKLRHIQIGDRVSIRLMAYGAPLTGHVDSVARAITDRDNALGNDLIANVNPTFSWVRLAQRIPVRIAIDDIPKGIVLSAGMTATVVVTDPDDSNRIKPPVR